MDVKSSKAIIEKDYYIIPPNISKTSKYYKLARHMISNFGYKISSRSRHDLEYIIKSYTGKNRFCSSTKTKQGGIDTFYLTKCITDDENTVIYSIENDILLDCVLTFSPSNMSDSSSDSSDSSSDSSDSSYSNKKSIQFDENTIIIKAFCANQVVVSKKGGVFFEHFLDSVRNKYINIKLLPFSKEFYDSFYFQEKKGKSKTIMFRTLSNTKTRTRKRKDKFEKILTNKVYKHNIERLTKSFTKNTNIKQHHSRKVRSI
jgi:hypothetical protein